MVDGSWSFQRSSTELDAKAEAGNVRVWQVAALILAIALAVATIDLGWQLLINGDH